MTTRNAAGSANRQLRNWVAWMNVRSDTPVLNAANAPNAALTGKLASSQCTVEQPGAGHRFFHDAVAAQPPFAGAVHRWRNRQRRTGAGVAQEQRDAVLSQPLAVAQQRRIAPCVGPDRVDPDLHTGDLGLLPGITVFKRDDVRERVEHVSGAIGTLQLCR